ncbi:MAG: heme ABC exporter ATP-binding protein CcmA [Pseudomonadota bacterium]
MELHAQNITVLRGEDVIIEDLSLSVTRGRAIVLRGANGAGKSTLLRALAGLLPLAGGTLTHHDHTGEFADIPLEHLCHYLGTDNAMKPAMTVAENLTFWRGFDGRPHLHVDEALDMVGLDGLQAVPFAHLSTGQRRRIAICRLLVSYRPVWLLDEPTSGLDAASERQFNDLMAAHLEDDGLIIAATHVPLDLADAQTVVIGDEPYDVDGSA